MKYNVLKLTRSFPEISCYLPRLLQVVEPFVIKMEQVNLGYSMKNIPLPSKKVYRQMMINSNAFEPNGATLNKRSEL